MLDTPHDCAADSTTGEFAATLVCLDDFTWDYTLDNSLEENGQNLGVHMSADESSKASLVDEIIELGNYPHVGTASLDTVTPAERRAQSNKLAQRRARARRKAHVQGTEAQLAVTSAELQQLQDKQKALEARNSLLEKVVQLNQTTQKPERRAHSAVVVGTCYLRCDAYACTMCLGCHTAEL